jgi:arginine exporter protein ArgO
MTCSYKYQIFLLLDSILLVFSVTGLGFGCGFEIQWLILLGVLGIAVTMLIGVVLLETIRRQTAMRKAQEELYTIDHVTIIDPTS